MITSTSIATSIISFGLIAGGAAICTCVSRPLVSNSEVKAPLNPFGINTSPYGEVFAMAMQEPIDVYWHSTDRESHSHEDHIHDPSHPGKESESHEEKSHSAPPAKGFRDRTRQFLDGLSSASTDRTNPKPASQAHTRYIRRQIENKLQFAYQLDPAHYANYNSYHFFLTEPALGTRPELTPGAIKLADQTIRYCLAKTDDPRPALTAAAATENLLQLMFDDRLKRSPRHFTTAQMRQYLDLLDRCIAQYDAISKHWTKTGNWSLLSDQRRLECHDRYHFILKVRQTSEDTIRRLEREKSTAPDIGATQ